MLRFLGFLFVLLVGVLNLFGMIYTAFADDYGNAFICFVLTTICFVIVIHMIRSEV